MLPVLGLPPALAYGTHDYEVGTASSHGLLEESAQPAHLDFVSGKGFELLPEREQLQLHTLTVTRRTATFFANDAEVLAVESLLESPRRRRSMRPTMEMSWCSPSISRRHGSRCSCP